MSGPSDEEAEAERLRKKWDVDNFNPNKIADDEQRRMAKGLLGERGLNRHQNLKSGQRYRPPFVRYEFYYKAPDEWRWNSGGWTFLKIEDGVQTALAYGLSEAAVREMAREYQARGLVVKECVTEAYRHQQAKAALKPRPTKNPPESQRRRMLEIYGSFTHGKR